MATQLPGRVDAVLLDVGGVFVLPDHAEIVAAGARAGIAVDPGRLDAAHYAAIAAWDRSTEVELWRPYVAAYFEAAGVPAAQLDRRGRRGVEHQPRADLEFEHEDDWTNQQDNINALSHARNRVLKIDRALKSSQCFFKYSYFL